MGAVPSDVGYLTLTASAIEAVADSTDTEPYPDAIPANAKVAIWAENLPSADPYVTHVSDGQIVLLPPKGSGAIKGMISEGILYAPADGTGTGADLGDADVDLVAPLQSSLSANGWNWVVQVSDVTGTWSFTKRFTGSPGDTINLGLAYLASMFAATYQPQLLIVAGGVTAGENPDLDAPAGMYVFDSTTGSIYRAS